MRHSTLRGPNGDIYCPCDYEAFNLSHERSLEVGASSYSIGILMESRIFNIFSDAAIL